MTNEELWSQGNLARPESLNLRRFAFIAADPYRTRDEDAWARGFRDALKAVGLCPDWGEVFASRVAQ